MENQDWGLAALLGSIHFIFHLFIRLLPPLIPILTVALGYPLWKLGLLMSGYFAGSSIGLLPMGVLSDRYDRRMTLSTALSVVGAGYVLFVFAPGLGAGIPARTVAGYTLDGPFLVMAVAMVVSGLGSSAHIPVGVPLLTTNVSTESRGKALGIWGGSSKLGDAAGPALVGLLIVSFGWQSILLGFGVLGVIGGLALFVTLTITDIETRPVIDQNSTETGATEDTSYLADRRQYLYPLIVLMGYFAAYNIVVQGTVTFVPTFITDVYGYTLQAGGTSFSPESFADFALSVLLIAAAVSRFVGGVMVDRYEHRVVLFSTLVLAAVALFAFSMYQLGPLMLLAVLVVFGIGLWGNSPARDSLISDMTPDEREGRTFSYLWTASRVFGALSPAFIGFLAESAGIRRGFLYLSVGAVVAALFVALLFSDRVYHSGDPPVLTGD